MLEGASPVLSLPKQKIPKRSHHYVDRDRVRGWEIAGPLFEAGALAISLSKVSAQKGDRHLPPYHRIGLMIQGKMRFRCGTETLTARAGELVFTPAGIMLQRTGLGPIAWLFINLEDIPMWAPLKEKGPYVRKCESADLMYILTNRITAAVRSQDVYSIQTARESSRMMVTVLKRELRQSVNAWDSKRINDFVKLFDRIRAKPELKWDIATIAKELNLSERTLLRESKQFFNMPPSTIVLNIRMDIAARMLINTDRSVSGIAESVGYESPYSFSRLFKKYIGVSPEHYRTMPAADRQTQDLTST